jgi:hypothetical protein
MKKYKPILLYFLKWQAGSIILLPTMWFLKDYLGWGNLETTITFNFIGATIFYQIDKIIFRHSAVNE